LSQSYRGVAIKLTDCHIQQLLEESNSIKAEANQLFTATCYDQAISCYDRALASCPSYFDYEVAVLRSNMAACYNKLEDWKASVDSATACLDCLERVIPSDDKVDSKEKKQDSGSAESVVEISGDDEEAEQEELKRLQKIDEKKNNVLRIRAKALMRRARAKSQLGGWGNLQGAEEDYKLLAAMDNLPPDDKRVVQKALGDLPARINQAKEKEMGEMMGKLKDVSLPTSLLQAPFSSLTNKSVRQRYSQAVWPLNG
jgi:tetratricopeptide (TPR) repeat protein